MGLKKRVIADRLPPKEEECKRKLHLYNKTLQGKCQMKIQIEMLTTKPAYQVRKANALTIGKVAKEKVFRQGEEYVFWREQMLHLHSTLNKVRFNIILKDVRADVVSQLVRHTKKSPIPTVQSSRPDWNGGQKRKPSDETYISFMMEHSAESWLELCKQRLCRSTMKETRLVVEDIINAMATITEIPFFEALAEFSVPKCVDRHGCCERLQCGYFKRFLKYVDDVFGGDTNDIMARFYMHDCFSVAEQRERRDS